MPSAASSAEAGLTTAPPPPSTAPVFEYTCLYTHDLKKKQKRWQDGRIKYHTFNRKLVTYDQGGNFVGEMHWLSEYDLEEGEEVTLERGSAIVQVSECVARHEQDLSELVDKRIQARQQRQQTAPPRRLAPPVVPGSMPRPVVRPQPSANSQVRHRPLLSVIGTPTGHHGRALVPNESPFEQRQRQEEADDRPAKRTRYDVTPPSKMGYARSLFGATLYLSSQPASSLPQRTQVQANSRPAVQEQRGDSERRGDETSPQSSPHSATKSVAPLQREDGVLTARDVNRNVPMAKVSKPRAESRVTEPASRQHVVSDRPLYRPVANQQSVERPVPKPKPVESRKGTHSANSPLRRTTVTSDVEEQLEAHEDLIEITSSSPPVPQQTFSKSRAQPTVAKPPKQSKPPQKETARQKKTAKKPAEPREPKASKSTAKKKQTAKDAAPAPIKEREGPVTVLQMQPRKKRGLLMASEKPAFAKAASAVRPEVRQKEDSAPTVSAEEDDDPFASSPPRPEDPDSGLIELPAQQDQDDEDPFASDSPVQAKPRGQTKRASDTRDDSVPAEPAVMERTRNKQNSRRLSESSDEAIVLDEPDVPAVVVPSSPAEVANVVPSSDEEEPVQANRKRPRKRAARNIHHDNDDDEDAEVVAPGAGATVAEEAEQEAISPLASPKRKRRNKPRKEIIHQNESESEAPAPKPRKARKARKAAEKEPDEAAKSPPKKRRATRQKAIAPEEESEDEVDFTTKTRQAAKAPKAKKLPRLQLAKIKNSVKSRVVVGFSYDQPDGFNALMRAHGMMSSSPIQPVVEQPTDHASKMSEEENSDEAVAEKPIDDATKISEEDHSDEAETSVDKALPRTMSREQRPSPSPVPEQNQELDCGKLLAPRVEAITPARQDEPEPEAPDPSLMTHTQQCLEALIDASQYIPAEVSVKTSPSAIQAQEQRAVVKELLPSRETSAKDVKSAEPLEALPVPLEIPQQKPEEEKTGDNNLRQAPMIAAAPPQPKEDTPKDTAPKPTEQQEAPPIHRSLQRQQSFAAPSIKPRQPQQLSRTPSDPTDQSRQPPRIVNPATRGRKAALKSHAAGKVPETIIPAAVAPIPAPIIMAAAAAVAQTAEMQPAPKKKGMTFPGFTSASVAGPWSREAHDLLGTGRPGGDLGGL